MNKIIKTTLFSACMIGSFSCFAITKDEIRQLPGADKLTDKIVGDISGSIDATDELFKVIVEYNSSNEDKDSLALISKFFNHKILKQSNNIITVEAFTKLETIKKSIKHSAFSKIDAPYSGRGLNISVLDSGVINHKSLKHVINNRYCRYESQIYQNGKWEDPTCSKDPKIIKSITHGIDAPDDDWGRGTAISSILFSRMYESLSNDLYGEASRSRPFIGDIVNTARTTTPQVDMKSYEIEMIGLAKLDKNILSETIIYVPPIYNDIVYDKADCSSTPSVLNRNTTVGIISDSINKLINRGAIVVTSTGDNGYTGKVQFPACLPQVISVTGYLTNDLIHKSPTKVSTHFTVPQTILVVDKDIKDTIYSVQNVSHLTTIAAPVIRKALNIASPNKSTDIVSSNIAAAQVVGCIAKMKEKSPTLNQEAVKRYLQATSSGYVHKEGDTDNYVPKMDCDAALEAVPEA
ncbi:S8/S53 family peptidase [Zooshikella ganghwensis]|uniref:S8/S53 family peptidase n=1 Tax=Zooshikella ganghwensis TaxID=202772 RepID=UPI00041D6027|nr:S8/S53 family peptidase [Zooshikella ganghwensis]